MQSSREPDAWRECAIARGLAESQQAGIAVLGEIVTPPCPTTVMPLPLQSALVFRIARLIA